MFKPPTSAGPVFKMPTLIYDSQSAGKPMFQPPKFNGFGSKNAQNQLNGTDKFADLKKQIQAENSKII